MNIAAKIRQQNAKWMKAFKRNKAAEVAALYAPDAVFSPPEAKRFIRGTARIRRSWADTRKEFTEAKFTTVSLWPIGKGKLVGELGKFTAKPNKGRPMNGKYVVVWQRVGAAYKVRVDIAEFD